MIFTIWYIHIFFVAIFQHTLISTNVEKTGGRRVKTSDTFWNCNVSNLLTEIWDHMKEILI